MPKGLFRMGRLKWLAFDDNINDNEVVEFTGIVCIQIHEASKSGRPRTRLRLKKKTKETETVRNVLYIYGDCLLRIQYVYPNP